jgi:putative transposase
LSIEAKVKLVRQVQDEFGLASALAVLGLSRSTWYYQARRITYEDRHAALRRPLEAIARTHPDYGYRRTTTELEARLGRTVNHKVVQRLHQHWELPILRRTQVPRPSALRQLLIEAGERVNLLAQLDTIDPLAVLHTDFTELVYATGKAELMALVDHTSKVIPGWAVGKHGDTDLALRAWAAGRRWLRRHDWPIEGLIVHHDQDPVYTGYGWTGQLLRKDHARLSYTLDGCRGNTEMESFHSRFKSENRSLFFDAVNLAELVRVVGQRITYYNYRRRHSALGNVAPMDYLRKLKPRR